ncbi:hypothetical protein C8R43DRAFT_956509 [Mycena crocata]|nr:hypothetical protein C8R43DRAFT_956509 [Mycena crocata]
MCMAPSRPAACSPAPPCNIRRREFGNPTLPHKNIQGCQRGFQAAPADSRVQTLRTPEMPAHFPASEGRRFRVPWYRMARPNRALSVPGSSGIGGLACTRIRGECVPRITKRQHVARNCGIESREEVVPSEVALGSIGAELNRTAASRACCCVVRSDSHDSPPVSRRARAAPPQHVVHATLPRTELNRHESGLGLDKPVQRK